MKKIIKSYSLILNFTVIFVTVLFSLWRIKSILYVKENILHHQGTSNFKCKKIFCAFYFILSTVSFCSYSTVISKNQEAIINNQESVISKIDKTLFIQEYRIDEIEKDFNKNKVDLEKIDSDINSFKKDIVKLNYQFDYFGKSQTIQLSSYSERISDIKDTANFVFAIFSLFSFIGGFLIFRQSKAEAKSIADEKMEKYISDNKANFDLQLDEIKNNFESEVEFLRNNIKKESQEFKDRVKYLYDIAEIHANKLHRKVIEFEQYNISTQESSYPKENSLYKNLTNEEKIELDLSTQAKPEYDFNSDDWYRKSSAQLVNREYVSSLASINKAIDLNDDNIRNGNYLLRKANCLINLQRNNEANDLYRKVIDEFNSERDNLEIIEIWGKASVNLACSIAKNNNLNQAMSIFDNVINRLKNIDNVKIKIIFLYGIRNKAIALRKDGNLKDSLECINLLLDKSAKNDEVEFHELIASALVNKGIILDSLNELDKAIDVLNVIIKRFDLSTNTEIREHVANALVSKGFSLCKFDRLDQAIECFELVLKKYSCNNQENIKEHVAKALVNIAIILEKKGDNEKAIDYTNNIITRFENDKNTCFSKYVANAFITKSSILTKIGKLDEAISCYDKVFLMGSKESNKDINVFIMKAMLGKAHIISEKNNNANKANDIYEDLIRMASELNDTNAEIYLISAIIEKGRMSEKCNNTEDALIQYNMAIDRYSNDKSDLIKERVAYALTLKASLLGRNSRYNESISCCDLFIEQFNESGLKEIKKYSETIIQIRKISTSRNFSY